MIQWIVFNAIETNIRILSFICSENTVAEKKEVVEVDAPKVVSEEEAPVDLVENGNGEEADAEKQENGSTEDNTDEVTSAAKDDEEEEETQNGDSNGKSNLFMFCYLAFIIHSSTHSIYQTVVMLKQNVDKGQNNFPKNNTLIL